MAEIPAVIPQVETAEVVDEIQLDYESWPRRRMFIDKPCQRRMQILQEAFKALSKKVFPRETKIHRRPLGLYFTWHYQVYLFLKLQLKQEKKALKGPDLFTGVQVPLIPKKELVEQIAKGGGWGRRVQERILKHEVLWVTKRKIPRPAHGRHRKIVSLLEDADTLLAVREYILKAGDSKYILSKVEYRIIKNKSNS